MLQIERRRLGLHIAEVFFADEHVAPTGADVCLLRQSATPTTGAVAFATLHLDLTQSADVLVAGVSKGTRYKIRRAAERDGIVCHHTNAPTSQEIEEFHSFYRTFAAAKGLNEKIADRLNAFRDRDALSLSRAVDAEGTVLCRHSYVVDGRRARLLHSASHHLTTLDSGTRNMIGRANRLLHWGDVLHFKASGLRLYDFGGLGGKDASDAVRQIDAFKLSFGGERVTEYHGARPETFVGRFALMLRKR